MSTENKCIIKGSYITRFRYSNTDTFDIVTLRIYGDLRRTSYYDDCYNNLSSYDDPMEINIVIIFNFN